SKKLSGSISAKRFASQSLARYPVAREAPWPPSFQPRKAAIRIGCSRVGRLAIRSSSGTARSLGVAWSQRSRRAEEERSQGNRARPDRSRERDVGEDELPRQLRAPLDLAHSHLDQQQAEHAQPEPKQGGRALPVRRE